MAPREETHNAGDASANATETTPLLATKDIAPTADPQISQATTLNDPEPRQDDAAAEDEKPLPVWQIIFLCYARLVEPMAFFAIIPYVNQMVQDNGNLEEADVGFYVGLVESLFSLTQAFVMIFWGKIADRVGRKPVLVFSLFGVAVATSIFGMAKTIPQMLLFRCLAGVFAGTIVTIRTMIAEHSTPKTQARAFSWFAFSGNLGIFFGPLLGGTLAAPADQYPGAFKDVQFFVDYPYALPSFVIGFIGLTAAITSYFFVEETLKRESHAEGDEPAAPKKENLTIAELVKSPGVGIVLYCYGHVMLVAFAYTAIAPLFYFTAVELGGFGFSYMQISLMMAVNGIAQALWLLVIFPPLQHRIGTNGVMRACAYVYPLFFFICPLGNLVLKAGTHNSSAITFFWIFAPIALALGSGVSMSFTGIQLALNDVSPSPQVLGTINALALTGISVIRAFSPALFTSLFAIGARTQFLWGEAIWVLLILLILPYIYAVRHLPEKEDLQKARQQAERSEANQSTS
ncbi:major facilitator superfamily transporter [Colletotrichum karsti]|uniref:Major facilitator superfamily transporter n=1 Tax=Colletotrichum karsti TaxID=1095194 RepID=A0A9P6LG91_9PEZI|nr:major facilitator superfamily transporter [Colletotrichum karsti]KAF9871187.1 major facilitator superfamily transporter [Colletotrichum karsti]